MVRQEWSDEDLAQRMHERDPEALETLIFRYSRELFYFIRLVLDGIGVAQDAEECTNDLFVAVWQEIDSFDPARGSLRTWLTMRAKYIALDRRRQIQRRQAMVMSLDGGPRESASDGQARAVETQAAQLMGASMEGLLEQRERREELRQALERLPELDR